MNEKLLVMVTVVLLLVTTLSVAMPAAMADHGRPPMSDCRDDAALNKGTETAGDNQAGHGHAKGTSHDTCP